jgi:hypothetical protein
MELNHAISIYESKKKRERERERERERVAEKGIDIHRTDYQPRLSAVLA